MVFHEIKFIAGAQLSAAENAHETLKMVNISLRPANDLSRWNSLLASRTPRSESPAIVNETRVVKILLFGARHWISKVPIAFSWMVRNTLQLFTWKVEDLHTWKSLLCSRAGRSWRSICRSGSCRTRRTWDIANAKSGPPLWGWIGPESFLHNRRSAGLSLKYRTENRG